ncbi:hypothetical protein [Pseudonocardia humida]|uniref:Mersacidin/lichenicidin family type 2 lantibiotic n=1 Tax=Pseudonocardia humida TaxID=2800819 RepID=A0ABT1AD35_9PSEU|nr:hypothetical protein [Pseudonocardia humida]MCO1660984.1 hypothetical protein [Pseudonocardia humida]
MDLVRVWKDPFHRRRIGASGVENPVGDVLLDDELDEIVGGAHKADSGGGGGTGIGAGSSWSVAHPG